MSSLGNLGTALAGLSETEIALRCFDEALAIALTLGDSDAAARLHVARGEVHRSQGSLDAARDDYTTALKLVEDQRLALALTQHRESFLGRERQLVYTRLVMLLAHEDHGREAWRICERSRSRAMLDLLAQSRWPAPAGADRSWWEEFSTTLDQIRSLDRAISPLDLVESAVTRPHHNALREAQRQLQRLLEHAPLAEADWLDLLHGAPLSWEALRQCLT
jgi:tetratricopeptide (TPR) repeat protein